jgi:hypothetical protein
VEAVSARQATTSTKAPTLEAQLYWAKHELAILRARKRVYAEIKEQLTGKDATALQQWKAEVERLEKLVGKQ